MSTTTRTGRVVKVVDGNTVDVLDADKNQHKIRLSGIGAPARRQSVGKTSNDHLADLIAGEDETVDREKRDRWKRIIGKVIHEDQDVNLTMVRAVRAMFGGIGSMRRSSLR